MVITLFIINIFRKLPGALKIIHDKYSKNSKLFEEFKVLI